MERRRWKWRNLWEKHLPCYALLFLFLVQSSVGETEYQQELKDEHPDPSKLGSLNKFLPYDSREDSNYKRSSSFFPLRGKKSAEDEILMSNDGGTEDKRAQFFPLRGKKIPDNLKRTSYFMPMRGRKDGDGMEDYDDTDEVFDKRASSFMPMRGKKKYASISDFLNKAGTYANEVVDSSSSRLAGKRLQFIPVRGKRSLTEKDSSDQPGNASRESHTNRSTARRAEIFTPMRGKRGINESPGDIVTTFLEKNTHAVPSLEGPAIDADKRGSNFVPMRGRRLSDQAFPEDVDESKRAQAFVPMRGRRARLRDVVYDNTRLPGTEAKLIAEKRDPSFLSISEKRSVSGPESENGFSSVPTRVRRSVSGEMYQQNDPDQSTLDAFPKKSSAFMPMRGRKYDEETLTVKPWTPDQLMSLLDKKSSSFMPMRGRKDEAFTMAPWTSDQLMRQLDKELLAFPLLRSQSYEDETFTVAPWTPDQLMPLLDKKASAFMPMRGRKDDGTFAVASWTPDQLISLLNKKSFQLVRGDKDDETFTVTPWTPDQLMSLLSKKSFQLVGGDNDETLAPWAPDPILLLLNKSADGFSGSGQTNKGGRNEEPDEDIEKKSSFIPMRGRRMELDHSNFYNPYRYLMAGIGSSLMSKPYSDREVTFSSVSSPRSRMKKLRINWDAVKRAFHASRGKRFPIIDGLTDSPKDSHSGEYRAAEESPAIDSQAKARTKRALTRLRLPVQAGRFNLGIHSPRRF